MRKRLLGETWRLCQSQPAVEVGASELRAWAAGGVGLFIAYFYILVSFLI